MFLQCVDGLSVTFWVTMVSQGIFRQKVESCPGFPSPLDSQCLRSRVAELHVSPVGTSITHNAINRLPQIECNVLLDEFPTVTETRKAIQHLSSGIKHQVQMHILLMSIKLVDYQWQKN